MGTTLGIPAIEPSEELMKAIRLFGGSSNAGHAEATVGPIGGMSYGAGEVAKLKENGMDGTRDMSKLGQLLGDVGTGVGIASDLFGMWKGLQSVKLAKKTFNSQNAFANANLENTVKSYNTRLADIYRARGATQGDSAASTEQAITANSLNFKRIGG